QSGQGGVADAVHRVGLGPRPALLLVFFQIASAALDGAVHPLLLRRGQGQTLRPGRRTQRRQQCQAPEQQSPSAIRSPAPAKNERGLIHFPYPTATKGESFRGQHGSFFLLARWRGHWRNDDLIIQTGGAKARKN